MFVKLSLAGIFLASLFFFPFAQVAKPLPAENVAYVTQAGQRLVLLQKFYDTNNAVTNNSATITDVIQAESVLTNTLRTMSKETPPSDMLAYSSQFIFAAYRCDNLAVDFRLFAINKDTSPATLANFYIQKENCANQIEITRLRLIDYASAHGIDISQYVRFPVATFTRLATATPSSVDDSSDPTPVATTVSSNPFADIPTISPSVTQSQTIEGLEVKLTGGRLLSFDEALKIKDLASDIKAFGIGDDSTVLGIVGLAITNTTDSKMTIYPSQGHIVIGNEQVDSLKNPGQSIDGDIFPGVTKTGAIIFALARTKWDDISKGSSLILNIGKPADSTSHYVGDNDFEFKVKLTP